VTFYHTTCTLNVHYRSDLPNFRLLPRHLRSGLYHTGLYHVHNICIHNVHCTVQLTVMSPFSRSLSLPGVLHILLWLQSLPRARGQLMLGRMLWHDWQLFQSVMMLKSSVVVLNCSTDLVAHAVCYPIKSSHGLVQQAVSACDLLRLIACEKWAPPVTQLSRVVLSWQSL
jgi:hypothetical protein